MRIWSAKLYLLLAINISLSALFLGGCVSVQVRSGNKPDVSALESTLKIGVSTVSEVEKVLGEPFGRGKEMMPPATSPRDLISYYFEEGEPTNLRRLFLYVFIKNGTYDGYMWFSSLE